MAWSDIQNGDTGLSVRNKINEGMRSTVFIGQIISSMLTESQMATEAGPTWVLCDGGTAVGSEYETITGESSVPDLRGQFLRGLDTSGTIDPDGAGRSLGDSQDDEFESHTHDQQRGSAAWATNSGAVKSDASSLVLTPTEASGGDETRPKNVSVNYFIKIN